MTDPSNEQLGNDVHKEVTGETLDPGQTEVNEPVRPEIDEPTSEPTPFDEDRVEDGPDSPDDDGVNDPVPPADDKPEDAPDAPDPDQARG